MKKESAKRTTYGYFYKGKSISKKSYSMYNCTWWVVNGELFNTLKEAKEYIDNLTSEQ
jgi:surface antigen